METNRSAQIRVGIFLALGLLVSVISILALGGDKTLFRSYIRLNARLTQVQGLNKGSVVSLSGMTAGNIEDINFAGSDGRLIVSMRVDSRFQPHIAKNSTVEIRTQGALGDKFIYINPGDLSEGAVVGGDTLEAGQSSDLMGILSEKGSEAGKIFDVISEMHKFMKSINTENRTETMMRNMAAASANFKIMSDEARTLIGELRGQNSGTVAASLKKLDRILEKIDKGEGSLGALINDPALHEQLKSVLGGSSRKQYFQSILQNSIETKGSK